VQSLLQVVPARRRMLLAQGNVSIVNAAAIHLTQVLTIRNENGDLRSEGRVRHSGESLLVIDHCSAVQVELLLVMPNYRRSICWIWIHPPKVNALAREFQIEALDFRHVTIGDRTIGCKEEQDNRARTRWSKPIHGMAIKVDTE